MRMAVTSLSRARRLTAHAAASAMLGGSVSTSRVGTLKTTSLATTGNGDAVLDDGLDQREQGVADQHDDDQQHAATNGSTISPSR